MVGLSQPGSVRGDHECAADGVMAARLPNGDIQFRHQLVNLRIGS